MSILRFRPLGQIRSGFILAVSALSFECKTTKEKLLNANAVDFYFSRADYSSCLVSINKRLEDIFVTVVYDCFIFLIIIRVVSFLIEFIDFDKTCFTSICPNRFQSKGFETATSTTLGTDSSSYFIDLDHN